MGNKSGKVLAGLIKPRNNSNYIGKIKDKKGELKYSTSDVVKIFQECYQLLYKVNNVQKPD